LKSPPSKPSKHPAPFRLSVLELPPLKLLSLLIQLLLELRHLALTPVLILSLLGIQF
jgi:hypothetical protein